MTTKDKITQLVKETEAETRKLAMDVWEYAELSFKETKSAARYVELLKKEGFAVEEGIGEMPTAFKASFAVGNGKPVVAFLAEYDALDGLSQ